MSWIAIDLDATLAEWGEGFNMDVNQIGPPIPAMVERVQRMLDAGMDVRIMTARVSACGQTNVEGVVDDADFAATQRAMIERWCAQHLGQVLPVTASKDFEMYRLYDDRAVTVEANTGRVCDAGYCVGGSPPA